MVLHLAGVLDMSHKATIEKNIKSIAVRGKNLRDLIHNTAVLCVEHAQQHGDYSLYTRLVDTCKELKSIRSNSVIEWFVHFGGAEYVQVEGEKGKHFKKNRKATIDLAGAKANPIWDWAKPEPEYKPYDLRKAIIMAVKQAEKHMDDEGKPLTEEDFIPSDMLAALRKLVPAEMPQA